MNIHLAFNLATSLIFIILVTPFTRLVDMILGEGKMDFQRLQLPVYREEDDFQMVKENLDKGSSELLSFLQENYNLVTLSLETNYKGIHDAAQKRIEYCNFVKKEYLEFFSKIVSKVNEEDQSKDLMHMLNQFDYLFQIHDSIIDLFSTKKIMLEQYIELKSDILLMIRELSSQTLNFFDDIHKVLSGQAEGGVRVMTFAPSI